MPTILIGQFDDFATADAAIADLHAAGIDDGAIEQFHLNAPGQHDQYPIGGDEDADRNARAGDEGAFSGAAIGAAAGLAAGIVALPIAGPFAAAAGLAVGAYTGSLAGAVNNMGSEDGPGLQSTTPMRSAGVQVAVGVADGEVDTIEGILRKHAARSIERSTGKLQGSHMANFDPVSTPQWIMPPRT
ncbi:MAG: hypothetical protein ABIO63_12730 [Casimicrobiaceae bacterium]